MIQIMALDDFDTFQVLRPLACAGAAPEAAAAPVASVADSESLVTVAFIMYVTEIISIL
jgi:hypothetical protein